MRWSIVAAHVYVDPLWFDNNMVKCVNSSGKGTRLCRETQHQWNATPLDEGRCGTRFFIFVFHLNFQNLIESLVSRRTTWTRFCVMSLTVSRMEALISKASWRDPFKRVEILKKPFHLWTTTTFINKQCCNSNNGVCGSLCAPVGRSNPSWTRFTL